MKNLQPFQELAHLILSIYHKLLDFLTNALASIEDISSLLNTTTNTSAFPSSDYLHDKYLLIEKYLPKLEAIVRIEELRTIYDKFFHLCCPDFNVIDSILKALFAENRTTCNVLRLVFPDKLSEVINYVVSNGNALLPGTDFNTLIERTKKLIDTMPEWKPRYLHLLDIIDQHKKLYPKWDSDATQQTLFAQDVTKQMMHNFNLSDEEEYRNSILQKILENEADQSPLSFKDGECQIIDVVDILTFHIDIIEKVIGFVIDYGKLLESRVKLAPELNLPSPTPPFNISEVLLKEFNDFFDSEIKPTINTIIEGGTKGLSTKTCYHSVVTRLQQWHSLLIRYEYPQFPKNLDSRAKLYYQDSVAFYDTLKVYTEGLQNLLSFMSQLRHNIPVIIVEKKDQFEEFDTFIKELYFDLAYIAQRCNIRGEATKYEITVYM